MTYCQSSISDFPTWIHVALMMQDDRSQTVQSVSYLSVHMSMLTALDVFVNVSVSTNWTKNWTILGTNCPPPGEGHMHKIL